MTDDPFVTVLAAGAASRFGGGKLDALCGGRAVGSWVLNAVEEAGLPPGAVVVGPERPRFLANWSDWRLLENATPGSGLASSLAIAARAAEAQGNDAMLVLLADMPLIAADFLRRLAATQAPAATLQSDGRPGVPALIPRRLYRALQALVGDRGAGKLLADQPDLTCLEAPGEMLLDIDTPDDLAGAQQRLDRA